MKAKYLHIALSVWIFAVCSIGFSESFPNRPTAYDLEGIVILGKESVLGVSERCYATQYQANPATYHVSPPFVKTNSAGWYLDQSTMGTMASAIKSLVPYYADPDTVYDGTTNITMFTVSGLFTELDIGNHVDKFTQIFASGTNAAVYGDYPWRMYPETLDERYNVMNALKIIRLTPLAEDLWTKNVWGWNVPGSPFATWAECRTASEAAFNTAVFDKEWYMPGGNPGSYEGADGSYVVSISRMTGSVWGITSTQLGDITGQAQVYMKARAVSYTNWVEDGNGIPLKTNSFSLIEEINLNGGDDAKYFLPAISGLPSPTADPTGTWTGRGWEYSSATFYILCSWNFQYCPDE